MKKLVTKKRVKKISTVPLLFGCLVLFLSFTLFVAVVVEKSPQKAAAAPIVTNGKIVYMKAVDTNKNNTIDAGAEEATSDIYIQDATPGVTPQLVNTPNNTADISPSWSPDGTKIVWAAMVSGYFDILQKDLTTGVITNLTKTTKINERWPVYSRDGTKIVYNRRTQNLDIWTMNADGTAQTYITGAPDPTKEDCCASFTPDGLSIIYASNRNGNFDLYKYTIATQTEQQLTNDTQYQGTPSSEANGMVVYRDGRNHKIFRINPNTAVIGSGPDSGVLVPTTYGTRTPEGSPDGQKLIFAMGNTAGHMDIYIANANGGNEIQLTNDLTKTATQPSWQPVISIP